MVGTVYSDNFDGKCSVFDWLLCSLLLLQRILIHSHSRVVTQVLKEAVQSKKRFEVYVTESRPNDAG